MAATVADIIGIMEKIAPRKLAETWDNPGLQIGGVDWPVKKIMIALDPSLEALNNAIEKSADMLITHHPLFFSPIKSIDMSTPAGRIINMALHNQLSVFSAHTNLDSAADGLNDILVSRMGLKNVSILDIDDSADTIPAENMSGLGRVGDLPTQTDLISLCRHLKKILQLESVRMIGSSRLAVNRVAVCGGSGSSLLDRFFRSGAQAYITGDVRYHDARTVEERGLALIDVGHFNSEHLVVNVLRDRLTELLRPLDPDISVLACKVEKDPFIIL